MSIYRSSYFNSSPPFFFGRLALRSFPKENEGTDQISGTTKAGGQVRQKMRAGGLELIEELR